MIKFPKSQESSPDPYAFSLEDNEVYEVGQSLSEFQVNEMNELFKDDLEGN